jgi:hypothetical protein
LFRLRQNGDFLRVVVPAFDQELELAHHRREFRPAWQGVAAEFFQEVLGLAVPDLLFTEDRLPGEDLNAFRFRLRPLLRTPLQTVKKVKNLPWTA